MLLLQVNLLNLLPESDRTKEKLADLLEDRDLSFLFPLLRIQSDLWRALVSDPTPHTLYKYIKDTLDVEHHTAPGFINALMTVLVKYITQVCMIFCEVVLSYKINPSDGGDGAQ